MSLEILGGIANIYGATRKPYEPSNISLGRVEAGHKLDNQYRSLAESAQWDKAEERGLTPQEYYGSGASGAPSVSGGATVLGNNQTALDSQRIQASTQMRNAAAERANKLLQTKIQSDTQIKSAQISAGATTRGQDITQTTQTRGQDLQNAIATKNYALAKKRLDTIETPKLLQELKISAQQFKKLTNEIATSKPKFMLYMKKLSMGVDNMMVEFLQHAYGVDITDPKSVQAMTQQQRAAFLQHAAAINSSVFKQAAGLGLTTRGISEPWKDRLLNVFSGNQSDRNIKTITLGSPGQGGFASQPNQHRDNLYN